MPGYWYTNPFTGEHEWVESTSGTQRGPAAGTAYQPGYLYSEAAGGYVRDPAYGPAPTPQPAAGIAPTTAPERRDLLQSSLGGAASAGGTAGAGRVGAQPPRRSTRELIARLRALVASGLADPTDLIDPATNALRPDILARADAIGPYRPLEATAMPTATGVTPTFGAGFAADEIVNPAELEDLRAIQQQAEVERAGLASRGGFYTDPLTGQQRVTATQGINLLSTFGGARAAEERYRADLERAAANQSEAYGQYGTSFGRSPLAVGKALEAYNRARGGSEQAAAARPITVAEMARGATPEQFEGLRQATEQGYTPDEWDELMRTGRVGGGRQTARTRPATTYFQAQRARGGF